MAIVSLTQLFMTRIALAFCIICGLIVAGCIIPHIEVTMPTPTPQISTSTLPTESIPSTATTLGVVSDKSIATIRDATIIANPTLTYFYLNEAIGCELYKNGYTVSYYQFGIHRKDDYNAKATVGRIIVVETTDGYEYFYPELHSAIYQIGKNDNPILVEEHRLSVSLGYPVDIQHSAGHIGSFICDS
jgi:hypothetical protein